METRKYDGIKPAAIREGRSTGSKLHQYDPMEKMIQRIRAVSTNQGNRIKPTKDGSDEVFCSPNIKVSVIKPTNLQDSYSVPVANSFDLLGN